MIKNFKPLVELSKEIAKEQENIKMRQLQELVEEKKKYQIRATEILRICLKEFIINHPFIEAIAWVQYTPYFNDGDECVFRMSDICVATRKLTEEEKDNFTNLYAEPWIEVWRTDPPEGINVKDWRDLFELNKQLHIMEEEMKTVFGDHVAVLVTRDSVTVIEYEHD